MNLPIVCCEELLKRFGYRVNWGSWMRQRRRLVDQVGQSLDLNLELLESRVMLSVTIDFDTQPNSLPLLAGDLINNQWAELGVTISTNDSSNHPAMLFDSGSITGGDSDLGTPNVDFGGPGIGAGGSAGTAGENALALNNVLIISADNDSSEPNDSSSGGTLIFNFGDETNVQQIDLVDIDANETVAIRFFDSSQQLTTFREVVGLGSNSVQSVEFDNASGSRLEVELEGSGAISAITFDESAEQIYVVDRIADQSFQYAIDGSVVDAVDLQNAKRARGAAISPDGGKLFVLNANRRVFVFDTQSDLLLGTWRAQNVSNVQGIATDGNHVWLVDKYREQVHYFENAANHVSGNYLPTDSFYLDFYNYNASGITTDGEYVWVVDKGFDSVFVYDTDGNWLGEWFLDDRNRRPTGIAVDPNGSSGLWVLDNKDDEVYFYDQGRDYRFGFHESSSSFTLDSNNLSGAGIAVAPVLTNGPPNPPVINAITGDSGASANDGITNDNRLLFSGVAEAGNEVVVSSAVLGELGASIADAAGNWIVDSTSIALPDGQHVLTATAATATETSQPSASFAITVDTTAPANVSVLAIDQDTGADATDGTTQDNSLVVSGATEPQVAVALWETTLGHLGGVNSDESGNWSFDLSTSPLPDGVYILSATATDVAGNASDSSTPFAVTVDSSAPGAPSIDSISDDTGASSTDGITNAVLQTFSGTAEAASMITLTDAVLGELATTIADPNGNWSAALSMQETVYSISATATDLAGNASIMSPVFEVTIDLTVPVPATITIIDGDSGAIIDDGVTNDNSLVINGTSEAGAWVTLGEAALEIVATAPADNLGNWSIDISETVLADGNYEFTTTVIDLAGNQSMTSAALNVTIDTVAPSIPVVVGVSDDTGVDISDGITRDNTLLLFGTADANTEVTISDPAIGFVGTTVADENDNWFLDTSGMLLADGDFNFTALSIDLAGNSTASSTYTVNIDTTAPAIPAILNIDQDLGISAGDAITSDSTLTLSGSASPFSFVTVSESTLGVVGVVATEADGEWSLDLTSVALADGLYEFAAFANDIAGNGSAISTATIVEIDTVAPATPALDLDPVFDSGPLGDQTTDAAVVNLIGVTDPNAVVRLLETGQVVSADSGGNFVFTSVSLFAGANEFTVIATDIAGNESTFNQTITSTSNDIDDPIIFAYLFNDTGPSSTDRFTTDPTINGFVSDASPVTVELTLFAPFTLMPITIDMTAQLEADGSFQLEHVFLESVLGSPLQFGTYAFEIVARDAIGNLASFYDEFTFIEDDSDDIAPPVVTLELLNDTGVDNSDRITSDATLVGTVLDASPVFLDLRIVDVNNSNVVFDEITDLVQSDHSFTISETRIEQVLGYPLRAGQFEFFVTAFDRYTFTELFVEVELDLPPSPPVIIAIENDTGLDNTDGITSDTTLTVVGSADPGSEIELFDPTIGFLGSALADDNGRWAVQDDKVLPNGVYTITGVAISPSGNVSESSDPFDVVIDNLPPLRADFDLDPTFDLGAPGDSYTTIEMVTLTGTALASGQVTLLNSGQSATVDSTGNFSIPNVQLNLGRHIYRIEVRDLAGNTSVSQKSIAFDQPINLTDSAYVTESSQLVGLGSDVGTRTITFRLDTNFGIHSPEFEDSFQVFLVDPTNPTTTLLDRGEIGTSLFSIIGDRADYVPGLVRFDGRSVEIDATSIKGSSAGLLVFQLIDNDGVEDTQIFVDQIGSIVDPTGSESLSFPAPLHTTPGPVSDVSTLSENNSLVVVYENIRFDNTTNIFTADIRVRNDGPDTGNAIFVTFDDLADNVTLLNASGIDSSGDPFVNMKPAIPRYGLLSGQLSDRVVVKFTAPTRSPFAAAPKIVDGGENSIPVFDLIGPLHVTPGDILRVDLSTTGSANDEVYFTLGDVTGLPNTSLNANGQLVIAPSPDQVGNYTFDVVASDGLLSQLQTVTLAVVDDPVTTTRISGVVMDTNAVPLVGVPVELGGTLVLTAEDGTFELSFSEPLPDDTLLIRGDAFVGSQVFPFVAEKLPLLLGHDAYDSVNNKIERPIYLPALDLVNAVAIDPSIDVLVTTAAIPNASVFVAAGSLADQTGSDFNGALSITEVPAEFTPAALPLDLFPDLVVTIQPGDMVFTTPAPLNLPNLAGYLSGTEMTLWSINPSTGLFDNVGVGVVSNDGSTIVTISGGINNSSWHFFAPAGPVLLEDNPRNLIKECDDCEEKDDPNADAQPESGAELGAPFSDAAGGGTTLGEAFDGDGSTLDDVLGGGHGTRLNEVFSDGQGTRIDDVFGDSFGGGNGPATNGALDTAFADPLFHPTSAPSHSAGAAAGSSSFLPGWTQRNTTPGNSPILHGNPANSNDTEAALHSGAVHKSHGLVAYQSLEVWRGLQLHYDSERADARPIFSTGVDSVQSNLPDPLLVSKLAITGGNVRIEVPGYTGAQAGLTGGEHFFNVPDGASSVDIALQADLRNMPTGVYRFESTNRFTTNNGGTFVGSATMATERFVHVNTIESPFGAGWGLVGLTSIVENSDGTVLLVDGDGGEFLFEAPVNSGEPYVSPGGDFSTLVRHGDGQFRRTHTDQTIEEFGPNNKLAKITDRNNNQTQFLYDSNDNIEFIIDPVGLVTTFSSTNGLITQIQDPAGRITEMTYENGNLTSIQDADSSVRRFGYDSAHHLTSETDKLGNHETIAYGFAGRVESVTRKDGSLVQYSPVQTKGLYRPEQTSDFSTVQPAMNLGQQVFAERVDANGNVTKTELDKHGQVLNAKDAQGDLPEITRNQDNLAERIVDGRGNLTIINYDSRGNVISVSDPIARGTATRPLFANPVYAVDSFAVQIVAADLNHDGFEDVVTENGLGGDSVSVLLNDRMGGYFAAVDYGVNNSTGIVVADVNNDGRLDVVTSNLDDSISVLTGNGDGTLNAAVNFVSGDRPEWIEAADLNNDGYIDIVTADHNDDSVSVLLGDGTGQFVTRASYSVFNSPDYIELGDLNGDGVLDVVAASESFTDSLSILIGAGDGTFASGSSINTSESSKHVTLGDVTGDGNIDIVTGSSNLLVVPGNGDGTFGAIQVTVANNSFGATQSTLADLDRDGDLDILFTESAIGMITVFENDGVGQLSGLQTVATDGPFSTLTSDLNLDGIFDVVTLNTNSNAVVPFIGVGDGNLAVTAMDPLDAVDVGNEPTSIFSADFNNDGYADVAVAAQMDDTITILSGAGDGTLTQTNQILASGLVVSIVAGDLNMDGNLDLISAHYDSDLIEVRYGDGFGGFAESLEIPVAAGPLQVKLGDLNNDSFLDIIATGYKSGSDATYSIVINNGDESFAASLNSVARFKNQTVDIGDINNDGNLDLVIGQTYFSAGNAARTFHGNGDGTFVDQGRIPFGGGSFATAPRELKLADLDDDGNLDIVGLDEATESLRVLKGVGNGSFEPVVSYSLAAGIGNLEVGDVDNDGILDVVSTNFVNGRVSIYFGQNDGVLANRKDYRVGAGSAGLALVDLDEDGSVDIVTADSAADAISIHINSVDNSNRSALVLEYDPQFSQLIRSVDEMGREVLYEVDSATGNTLSITKVVGELGAGDDLVTSYTYTSHGLIDTTTDPIGRITDMDYNARGLLERIVFAVGTADEAIRTYEYDSAGNRTAVVDELGHRTEYVFDDLNRRTHLIEADPDGLGPLTSPITTFVFDAHGNLKQATDPLNNSTQFIYDSQHRLVETIDAALNSIHHEYDETGNLTATIDRLGRRSEYVYDERNRLVESINAAGGRSVKIYDADNNVVRVVDENGVAASNVYDARDRVIRTIDALGGVVSFEYDRVDNLVAVTDEIGRRTEMTYDELDRLTAQTLPDPDEDGIGTSPITQFFYDGANNLRFVIDAIGNTTESVYDDRNRMTHLIQPDPDGNGPLLSPVTNYVYDAANRIVQMFDPLMRATSYVYDDLNRLLQTTLPDPDGTGPASNPVLTYVYDEVDNLVGMIDALDNSTSYQYDNLYRRIRVIDSDPDDDGPLTSPVTNFTYDSEGQLLSISDPLGRQTTYSYDELGRVKESRLPDPDGTGPDGFAVFSSLYDAVGNEIAMTDALGNTTRYEYDDLYRAVAVIEPNPDGLGIDGNPISRNFYDEAHQLTSITDALNRTTTYQYDRLGRIVEVALPDPDDNGPIARSVSTFTYDLVNNQLTQTDALGKTTSYEYDDLYRLKSVIETDPDDGGPLSRPTTLFTYDVASQLLSHSDPLNRTTHYVYDELGRVISEIYPDPDQSGPLTSPITSYEYDLMNNRLAKTDALGNKMEYRYDGLYRLTSVIEADPDGTGPESRPTTDYVYDAAGQMTSMSDPLGRITGYEYDKLGRLVHEVYPDPDAGGALQSPEMFYSFDLMSNRLSMTDALGNVTSYEYDNLYRPTKIIQADPDGVGPATNPVTTIAYDFENQVTSIIDPLSRVSSFVYDNLGRVIQEIHPDPDGAGPLDAPTMTYRYDLMSNQVQSTDALGFVTEHRYDSLYRMVETVAQDPDGMGPLTSPVVVFEYDAAGQLIAQSDPLNRKTEFQYDNLGRLISQTQPDPDASGPLAAPVISYTYDSIGNQLSMTDPNGNTTEYEYDGLYRLVQRTNADIDGAGPIGNPTIQFVYDLNDNLVALTDSNQNTTTYGYDELDRQISETIELGAGNHKSRLFEYDSMNHLIRKTDRNHRVVEYNYDKLYRLVEERWFDDQASLVNTIQSSFDNANQLSSVLDSVNDAELFYAYDDLGRVTQTIIDNGGPVIVFDQEYDINSRLIQQSASIDAVDDYQNSFTYDGLNRRVQQRQSSQSGNAVADKLVSYDYNTAGQFIAMSRFAELQGNDEVSNTLYEYDGIGRLIGLTHNSGAEILADYEFRFDPGSRINQVINSNDGTSSYTYDNIDQLSSEVFDFQADRNYQYDENGNRTNLGHLTGNYNRLLSDGKFDYEYDNEGNRIKRIDDATGEVTEYGWDHRNRLISVVTRSSGTSPAIQTVAHRYDAFNQWIARDVDGDGPGNVLSTQFVHDFGQIAIEFDDLGDLSHRYLWGPGTDQLVADEQTGGQLLWVHGDHLNSVRDVVDSNGTRLNHVTYDSFGNVTSQTNPTINILFGFTARAFDDSTELQNNLNRWYDSVTGQWVSEDPISFSAGDANLYRYVGNNVANFIDANGLEESLLSDAEAYMDRFSSRFVENFTGVGTSTGDLIFNRIRPVVGEAVAIVATGTYAGASQILGDKSGANRALGVSKRIANNSLLYNPSADLRKHVAKHGAAATRTKLQEALSYARLSDAAYNSNIGDRIGEFSVQRTWTDPNTGFRAALFQDKISCEFVLAFAGTDSGPSGEDFWAKDWVQNILQGQGAKTEQYEQAIALTKLVKSEYGGDIVSLAGHSLGGGLASAAALVNDLNAYVLNPAGVHQRTLSRHGADFSKEKQLIHGIRLWGEALTTTQNFIAGWPIPDSPVNLLTIPTRSNVPSPITNHGSTLMVAALKDLLGE